MYEFVDTIETGKMNRLLPTEALLLAEGAIEKQIDGYRTLAVSGRELMTSELNTVRRTSNDGALYLGKSYPPRTITVLYELKADDSEDFRFKYEKLNRLLSGEQMELRFNDDKTNVFYGTLSDTGEVPEGKNTVTSTFSFYCSNPYKFADAVITTGNDLTVDFYDGYKTMPSKIVVIPSASTNMITLKHDGKQIRLTEGSFASGDRIIFDFYAETIVKESNPSKSLKNKLDLASEFENFYLKSKEPIELVEAGEIELHFREVLL